MNCQCNTEIPMQCIFITTIRLYWCCRCGRIAKATLLSSGDDGIEWLIPTQCQPLMNVDTEILADIDRYREYISDRINDWDIAGMIDFIWELIDGSVDIPDWIACWQAAYTEANE